MGEREVCLVYVDDTASSEMGVPPPDDYRGYACVLPKGHSGPHDWREATPLPPGGGEPGERGARDVLEQMLLTSDVPPELWGAALDDYRRSIRRPLLEAIEPTLENGGLGEGPSVRAAALALGQPPKLCEDEGCPHYGTPHVCVTRGASAGDEAWADKVGRNAAARRNPTLADMERAPASGAAGPPLTEDERKHFERCFSAEMYGSMVKRLWASEAHWKARAEERLKLMTEWEEIAASERARAERAIAALRATRSLLIDGRPASALANLDEVLWALSGARPGEGQ